MKPKWLGRLRSMTLIRSRASKQRSVSLVPALRGAATAASLTTGEKTPEIGRPDGELPSVATAPPARKTSARTPSPPPPKRPHQLAGEDAPLVAVGDCLA